MSPPLYHELGGVPDGRRVLYVNGTGGDLRARPGPFDSPLARHFQVLAYDHRGLGRSPLPTSPPTMADFADDAAAVLDAVGWPQASVVGVSFGGMVAQELALRHPDRVDRMVLACTSAGGAGGASYPLHDLIGLDPEAHVTAVLELADARLDEAWRERHPDAWEALLAQAAERASVGAGEPGRAEGAVMQLEARRHHDTWDRLAGVDRPTLVCGGVHDRIAPPANQVALAGAIPGARLTMFDGGHRFLIEDPAAWPAVVDFLLG